MRQFQVAILFFFACISLGLNSILNIYSLDLKGTTWNSQFYTYSNFYSFETSDSGTLELGNLASRMAIDPEELEKKGISGNDYLYEAPRKFNYTIKDTVLIIDFDMNGLDQDIFHYRSEYDDWVSDHEYAYGREFLKRGKKVKLSDY